MSEIVQGKEETKMREFFPSEQIGVYNEENPHNLLLMAWNLFQKRNTTHAALTAVTEAGFVLETSLQPSFSSKVEKKTLVHKFEVAVKDEAEFRVYMSDMARRSNTPCLAFGFSTLWAWACLGLWAVTIARCVSEEKDITRTSVFYGYYVVFTSSLVIFPERILACYTMALLVLSHFIEAAYTAYICLSLGFHWTASISWFCLTFIVGYPVMTRMQYLESLKNSKGIHLKSD
jgi:hypothetical protein